MIEDPEFGQTSFISETEKNYYTALIELGCMATEEMNARQFENINVGEVVCIEAVLGEDLKISKSWNQWNMMRQWQVLIKKNVKDNQRRIWSYDGLQGIQIGQSERSTA